MNILQLLDEIRKFLEGDPLIAAAVNLDVLPSTRQMLADHLLAVETDVAVVRAAAEAAVRDAPVP